MAIQSESKKLLKHNIKSIIYRCIYNEREAIVKHRFILNDTKNDLMLKIMKEQTTIEARTILKCKMSGIAVPTLYLINLRNCKIIMENVSGIPVHDFLKDNYNNTEAITTVLFEIGVILGEMHKNNVVHGNLNTFNMLLKDNGSIVLINFDLSCLNPSTDDKVMDLYILEHSFNDIHWQILNKFWLIFTSYKEVNVTNFSLILDKLNHLKTTSTMFYSEDNSMSENGTSHLQLRSKNELARKKSLKYKSAEEVLHKDIDTRNHSTKNKTLKSIKKTNTITKEPHVEINKGQLEDNTLRELKLNIKRIDETNYISILSPHSLKILEKSQDKSPINSCSPTTPKKNSRKSLRWSERNENDIMNLVDEFMNDSDDNEILNTPKKHSRKFSESSSNSNESNDEEDEMSITPKKPALRSSTLDKSINTLTPKRVRKSVCRFGESVDVDEIELINTPPENKRTRRTSVSSTTSRSNHEVNTLECVTPKRIRKSVCRLGELVDSSKIKITNSPRSDKIGKKKMSTNNDEDMDFEFDIWKTPVNKNLRKSMTPTTRSGSKVRRSILQDIPENKEIEVISTPKTPRKTPRAHVKNLTASASKRLDSGARVPCSPLEKARANLHLHAAPKHLPCREIEFKSIHSFLSRKINDELTGSMYISGVPGTGKTATVKRVIDSLNTDLIMKHSFKFIEINGLRLANPHQAFSVIWKELTEETVSSSRAQAFLNDYFSGKEVRKLSTILLVDEVDHICNRKQDVVYNILDWPSRTGSKVVVITIANTMDLPERVLRGCVTSRMGLTRLVFKPYTFQQLQEIIMNRLIGNSTFDPDAVQLVARKVAAISGDARRALDICRRSIDLIKSEDTQFITINHVNEVLNSILSGVRVTAIRNCSLLEKFFLRALRDETTRTGFDHSTIDSVYIQMKSICLLEGEELPNDQQVIMMAYRLRDNGLIFLEKKRLDIFRKVSLNVSPEDIDYALDKYNI